MPIVKYPNDTMALFYKTYNESKRTRSYLSREQHMKQMKEIERRMANPVNVDQPSVQAFARGLQNLQKCLMVPFKIRSAHRPTWALYLVVCFTVELDCILRALLEHYESDWKATLVYAKAAYVVAKKEVDMSRAFYRPRGTWVTEHMGNALVDAYDSFTTESVLIERVVV